MLTWLSLILFSVSWFYLIEIFHPSNIAYGIMFIILGITLLQIKKDFKVDIFLSHNKTYFLIITLFILSLLFPYPFNIGFIPILIGLVTNMVLKLLNLKKNINIGGLIFGGLIILEQSIVIIISFLLFSRYHEVNICSILISLIVKLIGYDASYIHNIVYIRTNLDTYPFLITWEKIGAIPLLLIISAYTLILSFMDLDIISKIYKLISFLFVSWIYAIIRIVILMIIYSEIIEINIFYDTFIIFVSYIPLIFIYNQIFPNHIKDISIEFQDFKISQKTSTIILIFIIGLSVTGIRGFQDPGIHKQGRILIDEYHSEWEWTDEEFNKTNYGIRSVYNYYCLYDFIGKYYSINRNYKPTLNSETLQNYDILILKTPTAPYNEEEINDILNFVYNGGGLFLIGDHTNVFGMNYYLNMISEKIGIKFNSDSTFQITTGDISIYEPTPLFKHVSIQYNPYFKYATSCSITAPFDAWEVMLGYGLGSEEAQYTHPYFFGNLMMEPEDKAGFFLQTVAKYYGKGRVIAFSDSTVFSNFLIFIKGYPEFLLSSIEYLNRINQYSYINTIFSYIFLISLIIFMYINRRKSISQIFILILIVLPSTTLISLYAFSHINEKTYPLPTTNHNYIEISFVHEYSDIILGKPETWFYELEDFTTFFIWTQRMGCIPSEKEKLKDAFESEVIVIIHPQKEIKHKDIEALENYINQGGRVLLLDSISNQKSTSNILLQQFDMSIQKTVRTETIYDNEGNFTSDVYVPALYVNGGEPIFTTEGGIPIAAVTTIGEGRLIVYVDSIQFSVVGMKTYGLEPDENTLRVYSTFYHLFEYVLLPDII